MPLRSALPGSQSPCPRPGALSPRTVRGIVVAAKLALLCLVLFMVGRHLRAAWLDLDAAQLRGVIRIDWRWALLAPLGFTGMLLVSATGWIWLLRRMGARGPTLQLFAAYCFSQMGKYIPGKIALLLMRVERSRRFGVDGYAVTIATIIENVTYMVSGVAAGLLVLYGLPSRGVHSSQMMWLLLGAGAVVVALLALVHPAVLYRAVNPVLRRLGRPALRPEQRLSMRILLLSSLMMVPCWFLGGFALWASVRCLAPVGFDQFWTLTGVFALSVLVGMISLLPGGFGIREVVQGLFLFPVLISCMGNAPGAHAEAKIVVAAAVVLQRALQVATEAALGVLGGVLTASSLRIAPDERQVVGADKR